MRNDRASRARPEPLRQPPPRARIVRTGWPVLRWHVTYVDGIAHLECSHFAVTHAGAARKARRMLARLRADRERQQAEIVEA